MDLPYHDSLALGRCGPNRKNHNSNLKPLVSVIIPTCNRPKQLGVAIDSVLSQTYKEIEIIIVDNSENEASKKMVCELNNEKIIYLACLKTPESWIVSKAFNLGAEVSRGDYLAFLADDDNWLPTKLEKQIKALQSSYAAFSYCQYAMLKDGMICKVVRPHWDGDLLKRSLKNRFLNPCSIVIERDAFFACHGFDESAFYSEDHEFALRLSSQYDAICVPEPLVHCNEHTKDNEEPQLSHYSYKTQRLALESKVRMMEKYGGTRRTRARLHHYLAINYAKQKLYSEALEEERTSLSTFPAPKALVNFFYCYIKTRKSAC